MRFDETAATCAWVRARVDDFVDGAEGGLPPRERQAIEGHASTCPACRAEIEAAGAVLRELRAFPVFDVPATVLATAEAAIGVPRRVIALPHRAAPMGGIVRWLPAAVAAAALVALAATARWTGPVTTVSSGLAEARVERAARETVFALSYVSRCARMTGEIVADEVLEKRVAGTVGKAIDAGVIEHGLNPPLRRAMKKSGLVETKPAHERS